MGPFRKRLIQTDPVFNHRFSGWLGRRRERQETVEAAARAPDSPWRAHVRSTLSRSHAAARAAALTADAEAGVDAVTSVVSALAGVSSSQEAVRAALSAVREGFGWAYGSHWVLDPADGLLHFYSESGSVSEEFARVTATATFARGVGLSGRAWASGELVFVPDLGELTDC